MADLKGKHMKMIAASNPNSVRFREARRFEIETADAQCSGSNPPRRVRKWVPAKDADKHACPKCGGRGKIKVEVHEGGSTHAEPTPDGGLRVSLLGGGTVRAVELTCVYCEGAGTVSGAALAQIKREDAMWCRCEHSSGSTHHADGQGPEINKHHWRCDDCGGVTQIG